MTIHSVMSKVFQRSMRSFASGPKKGLLSLSAAELKGQQVLVRVDLNVPLDKKDPNKIKDDTRARAILPTVNYLTEKGAKVYALLFTLCKFSV